MVFLANVVTLFPELFPGPLGKSVTGRALEAGLWSLETCSLRDFGKGGRACVDDTPAGGGPGMVLRADVVGEALASVLDQESRWRWPRFLLSASGRPFSQNFAAELAQEEGVILVCGRFEGIDQRVIEAYALEELSIGDYVLSGGELGAMVVLDTVIRLIPGVMGNQESAEFESFQQGLLEYPHYTRPRMVAGRAIPAVLLSGNHEEIAAWRLEQAKQRTRLRRPDLWAAYQKAHSSASSSD